MKKLKTILYVVILLTTLSARSQVSISTDGSSPDGNAMLEVKSSNKGLLLPRLSLSSTTSPSPLTAHVAGMVVYNTATVGDVTPGYYSNDGTSWIRLATGSGGITTLGTATNATDGKGATVSGSTLTLGLATDTYPGLVSTTTQTLAGSKSITAVADPLLLTAGVTTQTATNGYAELVIDNATGAIRKSPNIVNLGDVNMNTVLDPPAAGDAYDSYIIPAGATGVWASHVNDIAVTVWDDYPVITWTYTTPTLNNVVAITDDPVNSGKSYIFNGTAWIEITGSNLVGQNWSTSGNYATDNSWIGTSNDKDLVFKQNGEEAGRIASSAVSLGSGAGIGSTTNQNCYMGLWAGKDATNTAAGVFIGAHAGLGATGASGSAFLGYYAGRFADKAASSVFIGNMAGTGAVNAANSIFIGREAGHDDNVNNTVTFLSSILIGSFTKTGGFSNSILLGSGANGSPISNTKTNQFMLAPTVTEMRLRGVDYSLPSAQGGANTVLTNNGSGVLSWAAPSGGITTLGTTSDATNANGATISGSTLTLGFATGTYPGLVSIGTQTIAGAKTFSSAITAPTATNTINNLIINAGALSGVTGYTQTSGNFAQSGTGTFSTATGAVSINGDATMTATKTLYLAGSTSGTIGLKGNGAVTSYILTLPSAQGGANTVLTNNGSGVLSWAAPAVGITTLGTTSDATNANGATISGSTLTLGFATGTYPGLISIGTQTIAGAKTFSSAITAPTATNTINNLIINAGALSGVTGYTQTSGNFAQSGTGTFGTGTGAVSLNGNTTVSTGRTLSITDMTSGSVLFAGASGAVSQNNANLFWNNTSSNLGIGTTTPVATAALDVTSTTKGFLPPRMTNDQMLAITPSATNNGMVVYATTANATTGSPIGLYTVNNSNGTYAWEYIGSKQMVFNAITTSQTLKTNSAGIAYTINASGGNKVLTLPTVDATNMGQSIEITRTDNSTNSMQIAAATGDNISGSSTMYLYSQNESVTLRFDGDVTWRIVASNRQGVANATKSFMMANRTSAQTTGIAVGSPVLYTNVVSSYGSDISLNTTTGVFTLAGGKTYRLSGSVGRVKFGGAGSLISLQWRNNTDAVNFGSATYITPETGSANTASGLNNEAVITTTSDINVQLSITSGGATSFSDNLAFPTAYIEVLTDLPANAPTDAAKSQVYGTVEYINVIRTGTLSLATGATAVFNSIVSGNIPYSTSTGEFTLKAGKTYELSTTLQQTNSGYANYSWYSDNLGSNIGGTARAISSGTGYSENSNATIIYTPTTDDHVHVVMTGGSGAVLYTNSTATIKQIGTTAATYTTKSTQLASYAALTARSNNGTASPNLSMYNTTFTNTFSNVHFTGALQSTGYNAAAQQKINVLIDGALVKTMVSFCNNTTDPRDIPIDIVLSVPPGTHTIDFQTNQNNYTQSYMTVVLSMTETF